MGANRHDRQPMSDRGLEGLGSAHVEVEVDRIRAGVREHARDEAAEEVPVAFVYNGVPFAVMLASPLDLEDFAVGFSLTEGVIESAAEFGGVEVVPETNGYSVYVSVPKARSAALSKRHKSLTGRTGCGLCGEQMLENALRPAPPIPRAGTFSVAALQRTIVALSGGQQLNLLTGAVHAAAWADATGSLRYLREDVGRHNALDKLIGALHRAGVEASAGFAMVTSRASYEMVHKAAVAGIPMLVAVSAPTALAIRQAEAAGLTLVGFAREGRQTIYAHPARLQD